MPKDGNCAIYVPSKAYFTLNACHFTDLKQLFTLDLLFFGKKIWAEALIELQLRQLLVIIPPQCVKRDGEVNGEAPITNQSPPYKKFSPEIRNKGAVVFFYERVFKDSKIAAIEEPLKKFWCLRPNFADAATPELPIFGKAATKRKLISENRRHWNQTSG